MSRQRRIRYGIDPETKLFVSEVIGEGIAFETLDYCGLRPGYTYKTEYSLDREKVNDLPVKWVGSLIWTRKIPMEVKNEHRKFWGFKPLKV